GIVRAARPQTPRQLWISSLTGAAITSEEAVEPAYWARQLRHPVRFSEGVQHLLERALVLLEVGPGRTLETFARQHGPRRPTAPLPRSLPGERAEAGRLDHTLETLGELWCSGCPLDWEAFNAGHRRRRISLPTYAFERTKFWIDAPAPGARLGPFTAAAPQTIGAAPLPPNTQSANQAAPPANTSSTPMFSSGSHVEGLRQLFADLSGFEAGSLDPTVPLVELGLDSLALTQAAGALNKR